MNSSHSEDPRAAPSVTPAILPSVEEKYSSEVAKAQALVDKAELELAKSRKLAAEARLKAYKDRLTEVTKSGDFDKAIAVKARIEQLEKEPEAILPQKNPKPQTRVIAAFYGVNQSWHDVTDKVQELVNRKKEFVVSDELFGDPAPGYDPGNTLVIRFEQKGKPHTAAVYSGRQFNIPQ